MRKCAANVWSNYPVCRILNYGDFSGGMTLDVGVIGLDFTFYLNPAHHTVSLDTILLKYRSEEKGSSLCKCSILLSFFFMSKKQERLRSELLSEDKITNLLGFLA